MQLTGCITVNNVPDYAKDKALWVCTFDTHSREVWFYGAWNDENDESCQSALEEMDTRFIVHNPAFY